jgi:hypothetical protein
VNRVKKQRENQEWQDGFRHALFIVVNRLLATMADRLSAAF